MRLVTPSTHTPPSPDHPIDTRSAESQVAQASPAYLPVGVEYRAYQTRVIDEVIGRFVEAERRSLDDPRHSRRAEAVLIESPTGSGKTVMGLTIARELRRRFGDRVGWVAPRRNLLTQMLEENADRGFDLDVMPISMFDKSPPSVDLLIVDEAQHDGALSMATLHGVIRPKRVLGLSATPYRADRVKLCFSHVVREAGIARLVADGYLSAYRHFTLPDWSPARVARRFAGERDRWGRSLIFFHTLAGCERCVRRLVRHGVRAEVVTAQTDRYRQIDDLEAGRLDVLVNMLILAEGFDCPSLKTVFCRPSGRGPTTQMVGRVLRRHDQTGLKQVVQCAGTRHPFPRTVAAAEQYLWTHDGWRALTPTADLDAITTRMHRLIAITPATLPPYLTAVTHDVRGPFVRPVSRRHRSFAEPESSFVP